VRWIITVSSGIVLELFMASLVAIMLYTLQTTKKNKLNTWGSFAMRLS
jgi:hypothetical protein